MVKVVREVVVLVSCFAQFINSRRVAEVPNRGNEVKGHLKPHSFVEIASKAFTQPKNDKECKTICQRFGMKALGPDFGDNPTTCSEHCSTVFRAQKLATDGAVASNSQSFIELNSKGSIKVSNADECKTICQRFGMKALGPDYGDNPTTCSEHCAIVFGEQKTQQITTLAPNPNSLVQVRQQIMEQKPASKAALASPLQAFASFLLEMNPTFCSVC